MTTTIEPDAVDPGQHLEVRRPGDTGWDEARAAWNLAVDQRPAAVGLPRTADDVVALVAHAKAHGLRVAAQATGHNGGAYATLADTLLIKTAQMRGVTVDPATRTARVEAGAQWADVTTAVDPYDLACLSGSSPDVGVAGYALGGGLSWLARAHGLCCNHVRAVELVTADGRLRRVDADTDADLFWALRGGGGAFGVVTAFELALLPLREVYAGALFWPWERAGEVLHAWRAWTAEVPETVTSVGRVLQLPPIPEVPEPLRGRAFAVVELIALGDPAEAERVAGPLRALAPEIDTVASIRPVELTALHMDPTEPVPGLTGQRMLRALPAEALDVLLALAGPGSHSPLLSVEVRHLGGALARPPAGHGALAGLAGEHVMFSVGMPMGGPDHAAAIVARNAELAAALDPWAAPWAYQNFVEEPADAATLFPADVHARLRAVKAAYDPDDLFRANHPICPATTDGS